MMMIQAENLDNFLSDSLSSLFGPTLLSALETAADRLGRELRVVGGTVRDLLLGRVTSDFDFVTDGSGLALAEELSGILGKGAHLTLFRNFGTAQIRYRGLELEFVGARKESYHASSRKPIVEDGTFADDERRRDFTINALSVTLSGPLKGRLHDPFDGLTDLREGVIRTPLDPDVTFSDDPLRMMRAVRFASQLSFVLHPSVADSIRRNAARLKIVSMERVTAEFMKIINSPKPSVGLALMEECGLMPLYLPEISALKEAETREGIGHKNNFYHTLMVVDKLAERSTNENLRLAALFHDVGKPVTKRFTPGEGWSFYHHDHAGQKMLPRIFRRVKLPLDERLGYIQNLVRLHMRPAQLADEGVTDSAIRRILFEAGDDVDDLMTLCESDLTSKNPEKVRRYLDNFALVREKLKEIEEKDRIRNFQPPVKGEEIMRVYGLEPCREVGLIKEAIKDAILDGLIPNDHDAAYGYMVTVARERFGLEPRPL